MAAKEFPLANVPNRVMKIQATVMEEVVKLFFADELEAKIEDLPKTLCGEGATDLDLQIMRHRIMAVLGLRVEDDDGSKTLREWLAVAMARKSSDLDRPRITFLPEACNKCAHDQYIVTDMCQNCTARPCAEGCGKHAIDHSTGKARIDPAKCVKCGKCAEACPFNAIIRKPCPCVAACPVGTITADETEAKTFHYERCIACGACSRACPFGAILPRSEILDVCRAIKDPARKTVAMHAPAVSGHFGLPITMAAIKEATVKSGFDQVLEVAVGADVTTVTEGSEFDERMEDFEKKKEGALPFMATSCCPAWVACVKKHIPEIESAISHTKSPMGYTGPICKERWPGIETVFVGPCVAKTSEGIDDPNTDYVLTFQDFNALIRARGCTFLPNMKEEDSPDVGCWQSRIYPVNGGVATAFASYRLGHPDTCTHEVKPIVVNGLTPKTVALLRSYAKKPAPGNIFEVMNCRGGCIGGPGGLSPVKMAGTRVSMVVKQSKNQEGCKPGVTLTVPVIEDGVLINP